MTDKTQDADKKRSKFLSLVLRHDPDKIGLVLDENGWVPVAVLLAQLPKRLGIDREILERVVRDNDKQRFALSADGSRIRASQGHSISVDLGLPTSEPPATLFHGTAEKTLEAIHHGGLKSMKRQHVHLSLDAQTALKVGKRHGTPVILTIRSRAMFEAGYAFYLSENGVWLTEIVPVAFIDFP